MALRFPASMEAGMPFVMFTGYKYRVPLPNIFVFKEDAERTPSGIMIGLYMPGDFAENISAEWSLEPVYQGSGGNLAATMLSNGANVLGGIDSGKLLNSAQSVAGAMPYPTDVQIFKGISPLSLSFNFNMMPMDASEGQSVSEICTTFKRRILPQAAGGNDWKNVLLKFPDVWDIQVKNMNGLGLEEKSVYRNMCLTQCNISYSSDTEGAAVYASDKLPVNTKLSLSFVSLRKQFLPEGA